jgi:HK97 family phage portal protein
MDLIIGGQPSLAGVNVSEQSALNYLTYYSCIRVRAETMGMISLHLYQRKGEGARRATEHPLYEMLHDAPNEETVSSQWRETLSSHYDTWGNNYSWIDRETRGRYAGYVKQIYQLKPDRMRVYRDPETNRLGYEYIVRKAGGTEDKRLYDSSAILHIPGLAYDGVIGYSPVAIARQGIGLGLALEEFGARFFGQGTHIGGVVSYPEKIAEDQVKPVRELLKKEYAGMGKSHGLMVLSAGSEYKPISMPLEDAQFLACTVPGTPVAMADGTLRPVEDLRPGDEVIGWDDGPVRAKVACIGTSLIKPLVRITTARGRTLTASDDHPILSVGAIRTPGGRPAKIAEEWIHMGDLRPGNYVRTAIDGLDVVGEMRWGEAYFLGAMVGDGYIRRGGCGFTSSDDGVTEGMNWCMEAMGGQLSPKSSSGIDFDVKTNGCGRAGSRIRTLLNESGLVGKHSNTKRVPEMVMRGGPAAWRGFLSGYLDTDGSVAPVRGKRQPLVYFSSINRRLLEDCQHLLAMLGVQAGIYRMHGSKLCNFFGRLSFTQPGWGLYVTGREQLRLLADLLAPYHSVKRERLAAFLDLPVSNYRESNWLYDRVEKVEMLGPGETVGVEIEGCHTHITGGIVTHNTRRFQQGEIAGLLRVPLHLIQNLERATFSNIEEQLLEFLMLSMTPPCHKWEQYLNLKLLTREERRQGYYFEFDLNSIMRGDSKARAEFYEKMRIVGGLNANEIRIKENMNPRTDPGGDEYWDQGPSGQGAESSKTHLNSVRSGQDARLRPVLDDALDRISRREQQDVLREAARFARKGDSAGWSAWLGSFCADHTGFCERVLAPYYEALGRPNDAGIEAQSRANALLDALSGVQCGDNEGIKSALMGVAV